MLRPDVTTHTLLVRGLATLLRVSDALKIIANVCRVGISSSEEALFGKVVRCPSCMIDVTVAQPQDGIQVVSCSKCRYQYELVSGNIVSIESEEISMEIPAWRRGLRFLPIKQNIPAAVHSIMVETPSGMARTHRFATETVDLPAQEGYESCLRGASFCGQADRLYYIILLGECQENLLLTLGILGSYVDFVNSLCPKY